MSSKARKQKPDDKHKREFHEISYNDLEGIAARIRKRQRLLEQAEKLHAKRILQPRRVLANRLARRLYRNSVRLIDISEQTGLTLSQIQRVTRDLVRERRERGVT
jgi:hypothetical protein